MLNTGLLYLAPAGTGIQMHVGGITYTSATVQAAFAHLCQRKHHSTDTFAAPTACHLGCTITTFRGAQSGANPNKILNLDQFTKLAVGVWQIIGRMQYQIPDTGITFTQIITAFSMTVLNSESQTVGS